MILNDDDLLDLVVETWRSMPNLVAAIGDDPAVIVAYKFDYPSVVSLAKAVEAMQAPQLMLAHVRTTIANRKDGLVHEFIWYCKARGNIGAIFFNLREDVPASVPGGMKFKHAQIHDQLLPPMLDGYEATALVLTEQSSIDFHKGGLILTERGIDT